MVRLFLILSAVLTTSCSLMPDWMGAEDTNIMQGERISVLALKRSLRADPSGDDIEVKLPQRVENKDWEGQGVRPASNISLSGKVKTRKQVKIGNEPEDEFRITSTPIIADGIVYTIDGKGLIQARKIEGIKELIWQKEIKPQEMVKKDFLGIVSRASTEEKEFLGGDIAFGNGNLIVTTGRGEVISIDGKTGEEKWTRSVKIPVKSPPAVSKDKIYFITAENVLYAISTENGKTMWTHTGLSERTSIFGSSSPVISDGVIVAPYSSGDIYALNAETGDVMWSDTLAETGAGSAMSFSINDINATPVVSGDTVFASANDGDLSAFDLYTGTRKWRQSISSVQTPWAAGEFLYVLTTENEVVCIHIPNGKIKWVSSLPSKDDVLISWGGKNTGEKIEWSGPILAQDKLIISGSHGIAVVISPYDGKIERNFEIPKETYLPLIAANKTLFVLSNDAELSVIY